MLLRSGVMLSVLSPFSHPSPPDCQDDGLPPDLLVHADACAGGRGPAVDVALGLAPGMGPVKPSVHSS